MKGAPSFPWPWAALAGSLLAAPGLRADAIAIEPAAPTADDALTLRISGMKPSPCWDVVGSLVLQEGQELDVRVLLRRQRLECVQVTTPYQTYVSLGQLAAGVYGVTVAHQAVDQDPTPAWAELVFTVLTSDGEPPPEGDAFIRGDATQDRVVDVSDAIALLGGLFLGTGPSTCLDAEDANDDGDIDISDALTILGWLFLSANPIAPPHPDCGRDPTPDAQALCAYLGGEC